MTGVQYRGRIFSDHTRYVERIEQEGAWTPTGYVAVAHRRPLAMRLELVNHSPDGFHWGYHGSGPAQLALALVADACGADVAVRVHQDYKRAVIARLDMDSEWTMDQEDVRAVALELDKAAGPAAAAPAAGPMWQED